MLDILGVKIPLLIALGGVALLFLLLFLGRLLWKAIVWGLTLGTILILVLVIVGKFPPRRLPLPWPVPSKPPRLAISPPTTMGVRVLRVIDGDTIIVELQGRQEKVRYISLDAPDLQTRMKESYGRQAQEANRQLVEGKTVRLEFDLQQRNWDGDLLAYVYLLDSTFVNAWLVEQGYAKVKRMLPNVKYQRRLTQLQKEAQLAERGLWSLE